jgi:hypothetical protein
MEDDRDDEHLLHVTLGAVIMAHYARRAEAAGRGLEDQLGYELEVSYGLTVPNPGDVEATQRGQILRRMSKGRILQG